MERYNEVLSTCNDLIACCTHKGETRIEVSVQELNWRGKKKSRKRGKKKCRTLACQFSSAPFRSRWHLCARKRPEHYAFRPASQRFLQRSVWEFQGLSDCMMISLSVCLSVSVSVCLSVCLPLSRSASGGRWTLPFSTTCSARQSTVWCPWLYVPAGSVSSSSILQTLREVRQWNSSVKM